MSNTFLVISNSFIKQVSFEVDNESLFFKRTIGEQN